MKLLYIAFAKTVVKLFFLFSGTKRTSFFSDKIIPVNSTIKRFWFHAASVGELESLWNVVLGVTDKKAEIIITVFSESAIKQIEKLANELKNKNVSVLYFGFSPIEGEWQKAMELYAPDMFITAKYEAWPELWGSLFVKKIPLYIVGAIERKSFKLANLFSRLCFGGIPEICFFTNSKENAEELKNTFSASRVVIAGEPRWERVFERAMVGNLRAKSLIEKYKDLPRPWGVFGSVWIEDIRYLEKVLPLMKGTMWFVPHKIDSDNILEIETKLTSLNLKTIRTASNNAFEDSFSSIIVNEMGFLSELYSVADYAYVGGGFTSGVHSTIEPAIHGIPVSCGTKNADKFPEIDELEKTGQLCVFHSVADMNYWFSKVNSNGFISDQKSTWKQQAKDRCGATKKILEMIL